MRPEVFNGRAPEMRDSEWLAAEDIDGLGDITVTIEKVFRHRNVEFEKGRKKAVVYAISFEAKKRQLVLNGCNRKTIQRLYGSNVKTWQGKPLILYVDQNVKLAGKTVPGIRVRDKVG